MRTNSKQKVMEAALTLFLSRGYPAATVDGICAEAGVSKGSFYHFFTTKEACGLEVLNHYYRRTINTMATGNYTAIADPSQRMFGFMDHLEVLAPKLWRGGCLMGSLALDLGDGDSALAQRNTVLFRQMTRRLARLLTPATGPQGHQDSATALQLAEHLIAMVQGSIVLSKAGDDWSHLPHGLNSFRRYLNCLLAQVTEDPDYKESSAKANIRGNSATVVRSAEF